MCHAILLADVLYRIHLIFHQSYQRRDDDGSTLHEQSRQLVAQRLSAACWHKHKGILMTKEVADNRFLITFESVKAKIVFQRLLK